MNRTAPFLAFVALLTVLALVAGPDSSAVGAPQASVKALVGGRLIDGFGGKPIDNGVIVVEGERIVAMGAAAEVDIPAGAEIISTEGMSVLPGLWDMHVHLMLVGHSDYDHWDKTYPPVFGDVIMPAAAKQLRDVVGPQMVSIDRVNGVHAAPRIGDIHDAVDDHRRRLVTDPVDDPMLEQPAWGQTVDVVRGDLIRLGKAAASQIEVV